MTAGSAAKWEVYGVRSATSKRLAITKTFYAYNDAILYLMTHVLENPPVHAVIVHLPHGRDWSVEREIVNRVGQGKAWWE